MKNIIIPLTVIAALLAAPAMAQDERPASRYASVSSLNWEVDNGRLAKGSGLRLVFGKRLSDHLSLELHGGTGGDSATTLMTTDPTPVPVDVTVGLKQLVGGFIRGEWALNEQVSTYALFGYSHVKLEVEGAPAATGGGMAFNRDSFSESDTGTSYGAGVEFTVLPGMLDGNLRVTADYIVYLDKSGADTEARSVGLKLEF